VEVASPLTPPRRDMCALVHAGGGQLLLYGGRGDSGRTLDDVWSFDMAGQAWSQVKPVGAQPGAWGRGCGPLWAAAAAALLLLEGQQRRAASSRERPAAAGQQGRQRRRGADARRLHLPPPCSAAQDARHGGGGRAAGAAGR
jgi:hypothetical protein